MRLCEQWTFCREKGPTVKSKAKWQKIGWRSLRHNGYPRMVFRFNRGGVCVSQKFMQSAPFIDLALTDLQPLRREAESEWQKLKEVAE